MSVPAVRGGPLPGPPPAAAPRAALWCVAVLAVALLRVCRPAALGSDLLRVAPVGFVSHFDAAGMTADGVLAGSPAARAGLRTGDRITAGERPGLSRAGWTGSAPACTSIRRTRSIS